MLVPLIGGADADAATMMGQPVSGWRCGPATVNGVGTNFLPGACRGA
jgi:hypothetical protein